MAVFQSSYSQRPAEAFLGDLADAFSPKRIKGRVARGLVKAGYGVFKSYLGDAGSSMLDPGEVFHTPSPTLGADVDAIAATVASSASVQTLTSANFDGVCGGVMQPARQVTFICNASTDWDATNVTLTGINHLGQSVSETLAIATSTTATSTNYYRSVTSVSIPAQTGAGGTATIGVTAITALAIGDFRGVAQRLKVKTSIASGSIYNYPGVSSTLVTANYIDGETVPVLSEGGIWVYSEEAVSDGDPVYVRTVASGANATLGAFRNDADTATCLAVTGAYFKRSTTAAGPAWAHFSYTA